ncbi:MAG TPA: acyltransferase family protein [Paludibacteraceae bacterium]|nr:acyltransferase family protein [Paludibacteraceae bacterium]
MEGKTTTRPTGTTMDKEKLLSDTLNFVRFPLIVMVIFNHSHLELPFLGSDITFYQVPIYYNFSYLFSEIIARITVPLFFAMSGFFFFYKVETFNKDSYFSKLKKRCTTLFIPFICWNLLAILVTFLIQTLFPQIIKGEGSALIANWGLKEWFGGFGGEVYPHNLPLWFLRDLIVVVFLSPLVYLIVKYTKVVGVVILGFLYITNIWFDVNGISINALFFFSLGAFFSVHKINFVEKTETFKLPITVVFLIVTAIMMTNKDASWIGYVQNFKNISGLFATIAVCAYFVKKGKWKSNKFLTKSSFFIYAYHGIPGNRLIMVLFMLLKPTSDFDFILFNLISLTIFLVVGLSLYWFLDKYLHKITNFITGSR